MGRVTSVTDRRARSNGTKWSTAEDHRGPGLAQPSDFLRDHRYRLPSSNGRCWCSLQRQPLTADYVDRYGICGQRPRPMDNRDYPSVHYPRYSQAERAKSEGSQVSLTMNFTTSQRHSTRWTLVSREPQLI